MSHVAVLTEASGIVAFESMHAIPSTFDLSALNVTAFAHLLGVVDSVFMLAFGVLDGTTHQAALTLFI